jgi:predicted transcriptional regulator
MKVKDLMAPVGLLVANEDDRLALAAQMMLWARIRHLPVVRDGRIVGVLSERDILVRRGDGGKGRWEDALVREVMSQPPVVVGPEEDVGRAAALMTVKHLGCLPVVEDGRPLGIVTSTDILDAAVEDSFPEGEPLDWPLRDFMQPDVFSARARDDLMEALDLMAARRVRHLPVVGDDGRVVGILSDRDMRVALGAPAQALAEWPRRSGQLRVADAMTRDPVVVPIDARLGVAVRHLLGRRIGALPVVDAEGRLRGIISYLDVVRALSKGRGPARDAA